VKPRIEKLRNQFALMIVDGDDVRASLLASNARSLGYTESLPAPVKGALTLIVGEPPHMLIFDLDSTSDPKNFLEQVREASPETIVILTVRAEQSLLAFELVDQGLAYDSVVRPFVSDLELLQTLDRAAVQLYHQFEAEQARDEMNALVRPKAAVGSEEFLEYLDRVSETKDLDDTVQFFMEELSRESRQFPVVYFKYLPTHASLAIAQASQLAVEKFRGIGINLKSLDPQELTAFFRSPEKSPILSDLLIQAFRTETFTAFTHFNDSEILGLFVVFNREAGEARAILDSVTYQIFELAFKRNITLKEKHSVDTTDAVTGLVSRKNFSERIENEISRSRRIFMPLSLITIDIDQFHNINERLGFQQADSILKAIGAILKKTTRVSDVVARTGADEFSLLFPHTGHVGASIKAERIRRMIESTRFPLLGQNLGSITVSVGVSEYPSFSSDAESLVRSADEALTQVREMGNKVCLATAPDDFKMDFVPREVKEGSDPSGMET
jgi:diguanylate cyclase (GGDEF)-like protein